MKREEKELISRLLILQKEFREQQVFLKEED